MIEGESINLTDDDCTAMETIGWSSNRKRKKKTKPEYIETIVIDDESVSQRSSQGNIIEVSDSENAIDPNKNAVDSQMNELYRENKLLATLIEECFNIENSRDMADILNKNILKTYKELDPKYKSSQEFQRVLTKALERLSVDPDYKFTYINNLWETMRFHCKKRVQLVTLATNLKDGKSVKRNAAFSPEPTKRFKGINNIDSDNEENASVINLDDDFDNDVVLLDQTEQVDEEKENKSSKNKRKEKKKENKADEVQQTVNKEQNNDSQSVLLQEPVIKEKQCVETTEKAEEKTIKYLGSNNRVETEFLVPLSEVYCDPNSIPNTSEPVVEEQLEKSLDMEKIKTIEHLIEHYKNMIVKLEQQEVDNDTTCSPYVMCERFKEKIVQLYMELCQLTGEAPVKRRSVRLTVLEGHPPGPVRRLEEFINSNIGSNGDPPFPDFYDVVKCVQTANDEDGLGWSKNEIIREARAIFTHCGLALQKRRQRRLYRDLASLVDEAVADPADEDPALLARLEQNRRVASHNEREIFEKFTRLQDVPTKPAPSTSVENETPKPTQSAEQSYFSDFDISDNVISEVTQNNENYSLGYENNNVSANCNVDVKTEETQVQIKKEPGIDILKRLEELGDNFTISIIDIQDPFLTIEISSDSSSDEG